MTGTKGFTAERRAFRSDEHERLAKGQGHFRSPFLGPSEVDELKGIVSRVFSTTRTPFEWASGSFQFTGVHSDLAFVDALYAALSDYLQPRLDRIFIDYQPALAGVFNKPPRTEDSGLRSHQDPSFVEPPLRTFIAWVPLVSIDASNGSFFVLPRTQHLHSYRPVIQPPIFHACDRLLQRLGTPIDTTLGDVVVFDAGLVHWSLPNRGSHPRPAVQLVMVPREAPFFYPFYDESAGKKRMELYEMPLDHLRRHPWYRPEKPQGYPLLRAFDYEFKDFTEGELMARLAVEPPEGRTDVPPSGGASRLGRVERLLAWFRRGARGGGRQAPLQS